jgi:hypothetical protein
MTVDAPVDVARRIWPSAGIWRDVPGGITPVRHDGAPAFIEASRAGDGLWRVVVDYYGFSWNGEPGELGPSMLAARREMQMYAIVLIAASMLPSHREAWISAYVTGAMEESERDLERSYCEQEAGYHWSKSDVFAAVYGGDNEDE